MGSRTIGTLLLTLLFISWSSQIDPDQPDPALSVAVTRERDRLVRAVNEFGYSLTLKMMKQNVNNNIVMSPSGIAGLLAMTLLGSIGTTYDELAKALGFSQDILANRGNHDVFGNLLQELNINADVPLNANIHITKNSHGDVVSEITPNTNDDLNALPANETVTMPTTTSASLPNVEAEHFTTRTLYADAIVVDSKTQIRDIYRDYLERVYHGEAFTTRFGDIMESKQLINDWVKNHTNGKIQDFLKEPLPVQTKVVLLSALYFSGQWARPFVPEFTTQMPFHGPTGKVNADLMLNVGYFNYTLDSQYGLHMIAFPYNDSSTTMYVLKPIITKKSNLPKLLEDLKYSVIEALIDNMTQKMCVVRFPKMDLKTKVNLKDSLKELGVQSMFSSDANFALMVDNNPIANTSGDGELLTRIYSGDEQTNILKEIVNNLPNPGLFVDSVLHDVKMTVNEYGTVAVAATSGLFSRSAIMFYADSPFFMFIRNERTKLLTFSAVIFDPTKT